MPLRATIFFSINLTVINEYGKGSAIDIEWLQWSVSSEIHNLWASSIFENVENVM